MIPKSAKGGPRGARTRQAPRGSAGLLEHFRHLHPKTIDLSLGRIERLLAALGNPEAALAPVVHIAGTNGKGSVIAFLRATLEAAGKRVHVLTSPHLVRFHERIELGGPGGGRPIGEAALADALARADAANAGEPITFFEITTAAALLAFAETPADFVLLETGLGGRLDATNVVARPSLTVITPVSIDHTQYLGDTLGEIAAEKAGILKPGVPCVVAPQEDEALAAIEARALSLQAPLLVAGREWQAHELHGHLVYQTAGELLDLPMPRLRGRHQIDNAGCAIAAARHCLGAGATPEVLQAGLTGARWPARLERLGTGPLHQHVHPQTEIWLDAGHNPAAAVALARSMAELEERVPRPLHLVCGMMSTKDAHSFFEAFQDLCQWVGTVPIPDNANAYEPVALAGIARSVQIPAEPFDGIAQALATSRSIAGDEPVRVLIAGSLYLAGHVLETQGLVPGGEPSI